MKLATMSPMAKMCGIGAHLDVYPVGVSSFSVQ
jgi:hypothetical protein